jgi:molecular chaperone GrpE
MKKKTEHEQEKEIEKNAEEAMSVQAPSSDLPAAETESAPVSGPSDKAEAKSDRDILAGRVVELEKLNAALNDQYLRKAADFDNYRKRMLKEKQDAIDFANTNLLVDLVQILDDFDRAIAAGGVQEPGTPGAALADGITIIRNQLGNMLENKYGLAHYMVKGELFDPHVHEAIGSVPSSDVKEATVMEEFVKGYKLKDRVIRVAKVMVQMPVESEKL